MKKIILIILIITFSTKTKAQVPDTLTYLNSIVTNKAQYVGLPFSVLMDSLKIQIKYFHPIASIHYAKNKETSTSFAFYFPQNHNDMYLTYPCLEIYWAPYLNASQSDILWEANNGGGWSATVTNFYAKGVISDIKVMDIAIE
jgi:hypothetical protein